MNWTIGRLGGLAIWRFGDLAKVKGFWIFLMMLYNATCKANGDTCLFIKMSLDGFTTLLICSENALAKEFVNLGPQIYNQLNMLRKRGRGV